MDIKVNVVGHYEGGADVLIDFSMPDGFSARLAECVKHGTPLSAAPPA
jgi:dihydrodipicolinate reductase